MTTDQGIADTILDQLAMTRPGHGRARLCATVGGSHYTTVENGVTFRFQHSDRWNGAKITLNESDLYDVAFFKTGPDGDAWSEQFDDVGWDGLADTFEEQTGVYLTLQPRS